MPYDRLPAIFVLVVAVLALGAVAATLDSGQLPTGGKIGDGATTETRIQPPNQKTESTSTTPPTPTPITTTDPGGFTQWTPPISLVVSALILALGGAFVFLFVRTGEYESLDANDQLDEESIDLTQVGEAAGDAADRIESEAEVSNEVYRAWREMVQHLNVSDPDTTAPDEFEAYAISAGMDPTDVSELTQLFEDVRYGEFDPGEREERAVAALRRIEAAYADDEESATDNGGDEQ